MDQVKPLPCPIQASKRSRRTVVAALLRVISFSNDARLAHKACQRCSGTRLATRAHAFTFTVGLTRDRFPALLFACPALPSLASLASLAPLV